MKRLLALGMSIGVLAGLWTVFALSVPQIGGYVAPYVVWIGFAAWAVFYAAGGRMPGPTKTLGSTIIPGAFIGAAAYFGNAGIFWSTLISLVAGALLAYASELLADVIEKALPGGHLRHPSRTAATS